MRRRPRPRPRCWPNPWPPWRRACTELSAAASWRALQELAQAPPRRMPLLAGFAFHTPARRALLAAWARRGDHAQRYEPRDAFAAGPGPHGPLHRSGRGTASGGAVVPRAPGARRPLRACWWSCRNWRAATARCAGCSMPPWIRTICSAPRASRMAPATRWKAVGRCCEFAPVAAGLRTLQMLTGDVELSQDRNGCAALRGRGRRPRSAPSWMCGCAPWCRRA